ncbi:DNA polymerase III subunit beta [Spiroplasma sabaudiense Ar-1343]|uniref:Beta sliding clamp n=1 Tax=Spiroplasma sabaudiense Ar-1343 TaxID=1276257 RepID=W6AI79_9MOLU|nr:DNA polymerase III subunit beta [Spiroplasma sabaudiense]AHI53414.1 DNA polymerase III subunit beta [Spiroplasma sabaudiense Ar-1343]
MNFKIKKGRFLEELSKASKIIDLKSSNPSLLGISIEASVDKIVIISSNGSISIKSSISKKDSGLEVNEVGNILVKGRYLIEILRRIDDQFIDITLIENNLIKVKGEKAEFHLNILDHEDYPLIGFRENGNKFTISASILKKAMTQTLISVDENNKKLSLTGLNFSVSGNELNISGTDSYRLSQKKIILSESLERLDINVPIKTINEFIKIVSDKDEVEFIQSDGYVTLIFGNTIFQSTILEGQFPDINAAFPKDFNSIITLGNKEFAKVISRADIPSEENSSTVVNLKLQGDTIFIKSNIQQIGNFEEEFQEFDLKGLDDQNISFNSKFFMDAVRTFDTKVLEIKIIDNKKPILITSPEDHGLVQLVLPMFTN